MAMKWELDKPSDYKLKLQNKLSQLIMKIPI